MSGGKGATIEAYMSKYARTLGFHVYDASSGSQGGLDASGTIAIFRHGSDKDVVWYFEAKENMSDRGKEPCVNVMLGDFADKLVDILASRDPVTWPAVFCLFTPHRCTTAQLKEKIRSLELNLRIPFKIIIWDKDHLKTRLHVTLGDEDAGAVLGEEPTKTSFTETELVEEIVQDSYEGVRIRSRYVDLKGQDDRVIKSVTIKFEPFREKRGKATRELVRVRFGSNPDYIVLKRDDLEKAAVRRVPTRTEALPEKTIAKFKAAEGVEVTDAKDTTVTSIDWAAYKQLYQNAIDELVKMLQQKTGDGSSSPMTFIQKECDKSEHLLEFVITDDDLLAAIPFIHVQNEDIGVTGIVYPKVKNPSI